jgi:hypothetical protein
MRNYHHGIRRHMLVVMLVTVCTARALVAQQTFDSLDTQLDDADSAAIVAIRALAVFERHEVIIYAIDTERRTGMMVSMQVEDSAGFDALRSVGWQPEEPLPDFTWTVLQLAGSPSGEHYVSFRAMMARHYSIDAIDFDDITLHRALTLARSFLENRRTRSGRFYYLIASSEKKQKPLALVTTKYDGAGRILIDAMLEGGSLRTIFNGEDAYGFRRLEYELENRSSDGSGGRDASLRPIWSEAGRRGR